MGPCIVAMRRLRIGLDALNELRVRSLEFIYQRPVNNSRAIMESLVGLLPVEVEAECQCAGLALQLSSIQSVQLLRLRHNAFQRMNPRSIIAWCCNSKTFQEFCRHHSDSPTSNSIRQWLKRQNFAALSTNSKLHAYVSDSARTNSGMDICFFGNRRFTDLAIAWRTNRLFFGTICICNKPFTRRHIAECHLLDNETLVSDTLAGPEFQTHGIQLTRLFQSTETHYTALDAILNKKQTEDFVYLVNKLQTLLKKPDG
jgi:hypothetical protein